MIKRSGRYSYLAGSPATLTTLFVDLHSSPKENLRLDQWNLGQMSFLQSSWYQFVKTPFQNSSPFSHSHETSGVGGLAKKWKRPKMTLGHWPWSHWPWSRVSIKNWEIKVAFLLGKSVVRMAYPKGKNGSGPTLKVLNKITQVLVHYITVVKSSTDTIGKAEVLNNKFQSVFTRDCDLDPPDKGPSPHLPNAPSHAKTSQLNQP